MSRPTELQHLRQADAGIFEARGRVWRQMELVMRFEKHGHDASAAKSVLQTMRDTLRLMEDHRAMIIRELAR
jgi:hypothetical protein